MTIFRHWLSLFCPATSVTYWIRPRLLGFMAAMIVIVPLCLLLMRDFQCCVTSLCLDPSLHRHRRLLLSESLHRHFNAGETHPSWVSTGLLLRQGIAVQLTLSLVLFAMRDHNSPLGMDALDGFTSVHLPSSGPDPPPPYTGQSERKRYIPHPDSPALAREAMGSEDCTSLVCATCSQIVQGSAIPSAG